MAHVIEYLISVEIICVGDVREHAKFHGSVLIVEIETGNVEIEQCWIARVEGNLTELHRLRGLV